LTRDSTVPDVTKEIYLGHSVNDTVVTKAIDGKDSASIKALIDLAIQYDLVAPPAAAARFSGVFVVPKALCEADQREIFTSGTSMGRIIEIILRHYDDQPQ